ncbi:uncharacterized protein LOC119289496 isoform X1 [Triticum dicoccoides]|uniref:uncharacterized protein LOC119289496 isoform X1 n=1 Tax=Triticum dicoccoides TaxID=85692 RepID=UPI00188FEF5D|nr:uncharacterized protein LOC119289496 isoform X1 [Triticum dicoccoides]
MNLFFVSSSPLILIPAFVLCEGCSVEDKLLLQVDGPSRLLCLFLLLPPHVQTQSRRCIEGSMSSPLAERQAGVGPAHRLSAPSRVSIHGSAVGDILWEIEDVLVHFLNTIGAYLRNEGRNNLVGEFGAEEEEQDIIYFLCTVKLVHCPTFWGQATLNPTSTCRLHLRGNCKAYYELLQETISAVLVQGCCFLVCFPYLGILE